MRHAPSMTGLRVLEAVVRCGSLSAAARDLCVTPAAISHRLRDLEARAGSPLVLRHAGRFGATDLGARVLDSLGDAFSRIRAADALLAAQNPKPAQGPITLHIAASYSFAVLWLAPRLSAFQDLFPEVQLYLEPSHNPAAIAQADLTILHSDAAPDAARWSALFADRCAAVARPTHPLFHNPIATAQDICTSKRVDIVHSLGPEMGQFTWARWAGTLGLPPCTTPAQVAVSAEHLAVDLVMTEDIVALVSLINATALIKSGSLRAVEGTEVATGCSYWVSLAARPAQKAQAAERFLAWVTESLR